MSCSCTSKALAWHQAEHWLSWSGRSVDDAADLFRRGPGYAFVYRLDHKLRYFVTDRGTQQAEKARRGHQYQFVIGMVHPTVLEAFGEFACELQRYFVFNGGMRLDRMPGTADTLLRPR